MLRNPHSPLPIMRPPVGKAGGSPKRSDPGLELWEGNLKPALKRGSAEGEPTTCPKCGQAEMYPDHDRKLGIECYACPICGYRHYPAYPRKVGENKQGRVNG
jgi:ribosomal protein S27AE